MYFGAQKYHDGKKVSVPYIFSALVSNMFTKVLFNERLPREKLDVLYEYDILRISTYLWRSFSSTYVYKYIIYGVFEQGW